MILCITVVGSNKFLLTISFLNALEYLEEVVLYIESKISTYYNDSIALRKGLLLTLWIIGQDVSYRCAEETLGLSYSSICRSFRHAVDLIVQHVSGVINYDKPAQFYEEQELRFANRFGVINVCCVMDGTFIKTRRPVVNGESYYSGYKKAYGLSMLVVSTIDREILYVSVGYPGSVHDSGVLRASVLWRDAEAGIIAINADYTILGDSAFPTVPWITISADNIGFASPRTISEHTFARLKTKFRIIDGTVRQNIAIVLSIVIVCCILSNLDLKFPSSH